MNPFFTVDTTNFERKARIYRTMTGRPVNEVFIEQAGGLFAEFVLSFPPRDIAQAERMGKRIERSLKKAIEPANAARWDHPNLQKAIRRASMAGLNVIFERSNKKSGKMGNTEAVPFDRGHFYSQRDHNGRVRRDKRRITTDRAAWDQFQTALMARLGQLKSMFAPAARLLRRPTSTPWTSAHTGNEPGDAIGDVDHPETPWIQARGTAPGARRMERMVEFLMQKRERMMAARLKHILDGAKQRAHL